MWDATDEVLVMDARAKAAKNGHKNYVTGTPGQLAVYKTFTANIVAAERKFKNCPISTVKANNRVLPVQYEKEVLPKLKLFLDELLDLIQGVKEIYWDSIDKYFVNKISSYINNFFWSFT